MAHTFFFANELVLLKSEELVLLSLRDGTQLAILNIFVLNMVAAHKEEDVQI
jgi:hypothetical protein